MPRSRSRFASVDEVVERTGADRALWPLLRRRFPVQWPAYYLDLVGHADHAIARMGRPDPEELKADANDLIDPVADHRMRPLPYIVRKHRDRVIVLVTKKCHFYCRFCFRRDDPVAGALDADQWDRAIAYFKRHPEIEEVILSGGDPLTLRDEELDVIGRRLATQTPARRWRIHTRAPVHFPSRVTTRLADVLSRHLPLSLVTHFNHADELTSETDRVMSIFANCRIPVRNQAVLLHGVNDGVDPQVHLWSRLFALGLRPHYLHHPDRVQGNARFRVSLTRGLKIFHQLSQRIEADALPDYVLDLPDGRGKVPVSGLVALGNALFAYDHDDGSRSTYRDIDVGSNNPS